MLDSRGSTVKVVTAISLTALTTFALPATAAKKKTKGVTLAQVQAFADGRYAPKDHSHSLPSHMHSGADITSGTIDVARLGPGVALDSEVPGIVEANDGSGSGLDADLLDGESAGAFATNADLATGDSTPPNTGANRVHWENLLGVPAAFSDGTDDGGGTASDVQCAGCVDEVELGFNPATQAELENHKNGSDHDSRYFTESELGGDDGNDPNTGSNRVHWNNLVGVPADFVDGADATGGTASDLDCEGCVSASELSFDAVTQTELDALAAIGTINESGNPVHWTQLKGVPDSIADGTDASGGGGLTAYCSLVVQRYAPCAGIVTSLDATVGADVSVAVGADGLPVMSYQKGGLKVAHCNDAVCTGGDESQTVVDATGSGEYSSITIGTNGFPVISYSSAGADRDLIVATCDDPSCSGTGETISPVDTGPFAGVDSSIAIGADGFPVMSYLAYPDGFPYGKIMVAKCNDAACTGGGETLTSIDPTAGVSRFTSLAIPADGLPVVAYGDDLTGEFIVVKCNDPACTGGGETLTPVLFGGFAPSMGIGADGFPVISFTQTSATSTLKVLDCNDGACAGSGDTVSTVNVSADAGRASSLVIGTDGSPVISYIDRTNHTTNVAYCNDPGCAGMNERIRVFDDFGNDSMFIEVTSIAIGVDGSPFVAFKRPNGSHDLAAGRPPLQ